MNSPDDLLTYISNEVRELCELSPDQACLRMSDFAKLHTLIDKTEQTFCATLVRSFCGAIVSAREGLQIDGGQWAEFKSIVEESKDACLDSPFQRQAYGAFRSRVELFSRSHPGWRVSGGSLVAFLNAVEGIINWPQLEPRLQELRRNIARKHFESWSVWRPHLASNFEFIDPFMFEHAVAALLECMGYSATVTRKSGDYGVDIIAKRSDAGRGIEDVVAVQVKRYSPGNNVGNREVQLLLGAMRMKEYQANKAILVTTSDFSRQAEEQAAETNLELWNGRYLKQLMEKYFSRGGGD